MFKTFLAILLLSISQQTFCQTISNIDSIPNRSDTKTIDQEDLHVFVKAEKNPQFPGGLSGWKEFLKEKLNPNIPVLNGAPVGTYTVMIRFIVKKDGTLKDFAAETKFGFGMETEVIRILKESPKWIPAMQNGYNVNFYIRQPVTFVVSGK